MLTNPAQTKPLTARALWDAYVAEKWLPTVERPLGRRGMVITTENPNAHLARDLSYLSYKQTAEGGQYTIACCDVYRLQWAKAKLINLGKELTIFARAYGIERAVTVEFVTKPKTEKF